MIDAGKYEGHTEGPWEEGEYTPSDEMIERFQNRELQGAVMQQSSNTMHAMIGLDGNGEKDRLLMADAPLLLEEVKRLDKLCWDIEITNRKLYNENRELKTQVDYYCTDINAVENMNVDLKAEVKQLRGIIDYIRDTGRMGISNDSLFLSIMEQVLTTEEYLEWRNKE